MISENTVYKIISQYANFSDSKKVKLHNFDTYPHVIKIDYGHDSYYLKEIVVDKEKKQWIEFVYSILESEDFFIHPIKNNKSEYLSDSHAGNNIYQTEGDKEYGYLLTKGLEESLINPSVEWWAESLSKIHKTDDWSGIGHETVEMYLSHNNGNRLIIPKFSDVLDDFNGIFEIMEQDVRNLIYSLVPNDDYTSILTQKAVLVHGDPLKNNVLSDGRNYYLSDFESCGVSIKEYDIQRLFTDFSTNCSEIKEIDLFIEKFIKSYECLADKINVSLLDYLFRLDLIRTMCWLYKVSLSYNRQDCERQTQELEKYKMALRKGHYHRVIAAINQTWQYNIDNIRFNNQDEIMNVARIISAIVPDFVCATIGGSRSHFLDDNYSDVEMYFYSKSGIPPLEMIDSVLEKAGAIHRRSSSFLWNEAPWGPHSFFEIDGLYFEIGYRIVDEVKGKIVDYLSGKTVEPQKDCHDLGLGYLFSGLTASVQAEKIVICNDDLFFELKELANEFPDSLRNALIKEYMETADKLIKGKLLVAVQRQDAFFYNVLSTRVIRSLMVMAFSISNTHFPGDKWNEILLLHTNWNNSGRFLQLLNAHMKMDASYSEKYKLLLEAFCLIEKEAISCKKE